MIILYTISTLKITLVPGKVCFIISKKNIMNVIKCIHYISYQHSCWDTVFASQKMSYSAQSVHNCVYRHFVYTICIHNITSCLNQCESL